MKLRRRMVGHYVAKLKALPHLRFVTLTVDQRWLAAGGYAPDESRRYVRRIHEKLAEIGKVPSARSR